MKSIGNNVILTAFFLLELVAFGALGYWGYHFKTVVSFKIMLAGAVPLVIMIIWGLFLSPKATIPFFSYPMRTAFKLVIFIAASAALYATGLHTFGTVFLLVSLIIVAAVFVLDLHKI
ncbi:YrdB family protein [Paenibacillus kobensis]|uniref:YrdB family protein n=1 Tax=Paenibacillus kobensis TaxID=59841 RepID=UPI001FE8FF13|nr:YrdB family protein [Paenibacillus kobensis]